MYFIDNTIPYLGQNLYWEWDFGYGSATSDLQNPVQIFDTAGTYTVTLTATHSANHCAKEVYKQVIVNHSPVANFGNLDVCVNNPHQFADSSSIIDGAINEWKWTFDTFGTSDLQQPTITFSDTGSFDVELVVITELNCTDTINQMINVHPLPEVDFIFSPTFGTPPLTVDFDTLFTNEINYWDFGDGNESNLACPTHTYQDSGQFEITLVTTNEFGCKDSISKEVKIVIPVYDVAVLNVTSSVNNNYLSASAVIANLGTMPVYALELIIDFGEGSTIKEIWYGELLSGQIIPYDDFSSLELPPNTIPSYVCVKAEFTNDIIDDFPENNEECYVFEDNFRALEPYPNPASNSINIEFIIPYEEYVEIYLYDARGRKIMDIYTGNANEGFNRIILNTYGLSNGVYTYQITFEDDTQTKQFIKE